MGFHILFLSDNKQICWEIFLNSCFVPTNMLKFFKVFLDFKNYTEIIYNTIIKKINNK